MKCEDPDKATMKMVIRMMIIIMKNGMMKKVKVK
jgi:hypothetical protein